MLIGIQQQVAKLSVAGPPSFPPPPPPEDVSSPPPPVDHMYETTPALKKKELSQDSCQSQEKEAPKPAATVTNTTLKDDWTPGYDVVSKPKKKTRIATSSQKSPSVNEPSPTSPLDLVKDSRVKSKLFERAPHLYEAVSDNFGAPDEPGQGSGRPKNILVPMRHTHIYESADEIQSKVQVRPKSHIPSRKRPPPPPPDVTTPTKSDGGLPAAAAAEQANLPNRPKPSPDNNKIASPVAEIVSNPMSYLGTDLAGKKLMVDIHQEGEEEGREPRFLFSKGHSSSFIRVSLRKFDAK